MSVGTMWAIAADDAAAAVLADEADVPTLWLDGIAEMDLMALGEQLGVPYEPTLIVEAADGGVVLHLPHAFLRALSTLHDPSRVAATWRTTAEGLATQDPSDLAAVLTDMTAFAQSALAGPGALSIPLF